MKAINVGERFGRLVVLGWVRDDYTSGGKKQPVCKFQCDCGNVHEARIYSARSGAMRSCGCLNREMIAAHRLSHGAARVGEQTPEYKAWRNMNTRGRNPNISHAARYVLRGITVCDEWLPGGDGKGFERFLAHVGSKPSPKHSLDRIDNDKGYQPGNVRWATQAEQASNNCRVVRITLNGEELPLQVAAAKVGIKPSIILQRIKKLGWDAQRALTTPPKPDKRRAF